MLIYCDQSVFFVNGWEKNAPTVNPGARPKARVVKSYGCRNQGRTHRYSNPAKRLRLTRLTRQYEAEIITYYDRISEIRSGEQKVYEEDNGGDWIGVNIGKARLKDKLKGQVFEGYADKYNFVLKLRAKAKEEYESMGAPVKILKGPTTGSKPRTTASASTSRDSARRSTARASASRDASIR